jgi:CubicO group peptidase (beta-lactamase class C family)
MKSIQESCSAASPSQKELVIVRSGSLIWAGPHADACHPIWSCAKTFTSTVLGLCVEEGRCTLDTRAVEREVRLADSFPLYSRIQLPHLASMCGGYRSEVKDVREDQPWGDPMAFLNPRYSCYWWVNSWGPSTAFWVWAR